MKKLLAIVVLGLLWSNVAFSDFKGYSFFDPSSCGSVYDSDFGNKVGSICFKFNERKQRGSYQKAMSDCLRYLRNLGYEKGIKPHVEGCV